MSIINDALKKTHINLNKTNPPEKTAPEKKQEPDLTTIYEKMHKANETKRQTLNEKNKKPDKESGRVSSGKKWFTVFITLIFLGLLGYAAYFFLSDYPPVKEFLHSFGKKIPTSRQHIAQHTPKKKNYREGELVLNGTSIVDNRRVALINDKIYEVGDIVDGKKVTSIRLDAVELRDNETIVTLKVR